MYCSRQAPLSMGFSRQEYYSGLPCLPPGDLPDPGIEPQSPTLQADSLPLKPHDEHYEAKVKVAQLCLTLCDPMEYTVHGILQARILEWVDFFPRESSQPRDQTQVSCIARTFFTSWATREAPWWVLYSEVIPLWPYLNLPTKYGHEIILTDLFSWQ